VEQAIDRDAVIVLTRAAREWRVAVPKLASYAKLVPAKVAQTASLGSGNLGPRGFSLVTDAIKRYRALVE
jgi:hypothetical protein